MGNSRSLALAISSAYRRRHGEPIDAGSDRLPDVYEAVIMRSPWASWRASHARGHVIARFGRPTRVIPVLVMCRRRRTRRHLPGSCPRWGRWPRFRVCESAVCRRERGRLL